MIEIRLALLFLEGLRESGRVVRHINFAVTGWIRYNSSVSYRFIEETQPDLTALVCGGEREDVPSDRLYVTQRIDLI